MTFGPAGSGHVSRIDRKPASVGSVASTLRNSVRKGLRALGVDVRRSGSHDWSDTRKFIPFGATVAEAKRVGLSVADYVDARHNRVGATRAAINRLAAMGVFGGRIERVCEIGPGSGRYTEKVLAATNAAHYEIYETAEEWARWLVQTYGVMLQPTDGRSLKATPSRSIDLVQAYKVFPSVPLRVTWGYLLEMTRVVRDGGKVVFDVMTESCVDVDRIEAWLRGDPWTPYPAIVPRQHVLDLVERRGLAFQGSFLVPMEPGSTECMVFSRPSRSEPQPI